MKRILRPFSFLLCILLLFCPTLISCSSSLSSEESEEVKESAPQSLQAEETEEEIVNEIAANPEDVEKLDALYAGRSPYFGDIHCHPIAGVSKDGNKTLAEWKEKMKERTR